MKSGEMLEITCVHEEMNTSGFYLSYYLIQMALLLHFNLAEVKAFIRVK